MLDAPLGRPSSFYPDLTDDRLSILAGIYRASWRSVWERRSPLSVPVSLGMTRYCEGHQACRAATRRYEWLTVKSRGLYYHVEVGSVPLRLDRLDGSLQTVLEAANLWLEGVDDPERPYLRLELPHPDTDGDALLRLLAPGTGRGNPETEKRRWAVKVDEIPISEIHGWLTLESRSGSVVEFPTPIPPEVELEPAEFSLRLDDELAPTADLHDGDGSDPDPDPEA